jgi:branched-chain amino acid transport system substrate-binding protein
VVGEKPVLDRDRTFAFTLVLTILAIAGFGVFLVRDYQDRGYQGASSINVGGTGAAANLPVTGGDAASPGATAGPGTTTTTGGTAAGQSITVGGSSGGAVPVNVPRGNQLACQGGEIKIGSIIPVTGPVTQQDAANALVAYFNKINNQGGINGCKVNFIYKDDGGLNNQQAIADAHALVQDEKVFAIVGIIEPVTTAVTEPYFVQQGVPVVGIEGVGVNEYNNPVEYSFAEAPDGFGTSTSDFAAGKGCKHIAVFYLDFDFGVKSYNALQSQAAKNGQSIDYHNQESVSSNSYGTDTVQARNALQNFDAKTTCVINILDANSAVREINAMKQNQWFPNLVSTTSTSDPVVLKSEASWFADSRHTVYTQRNYQPANANVPEVQDWIQTEGQYFPGFDANSYAEGSWLAAKVFTEVATRLGSGSLTRNNLLAALNSLSNYHTGFTPDLTMTSDHGPNKQVMWLQYSGNAFQPITGFQPW